VLASSKIFGKRCRIRFRMYILSWRSNRVHHGFVAQIALYRIYYVNKALNYVQKLKSMFIEKYAVPQQNNFW